MRTAVEAHELLPRGLRIEGLSIEPRRVSISVSSGSRRCVCPLCGRGSSRVHSGYSRRVSDLPWHGISVELEVRARRFFCDEGSCERRIFCERLPEVAARARKTERLEEALLAIVLELGGRAGARLAAELGLCSSGATPCSGGRGAHRYGTQARCGCWAWTTSRSVAGPVTAPSWWTSNDAGWWTCSRNARKKASLAGWSTTPR